MAITIRYGASFEGDHYEGKSVGELVDKFRQALNITGNPPAMVRASEFDEARPVQGDYVVKDGEYLELAYAPGDKGGSK